MSILLSTGRRWRARLTQSPRSAELEYVERVVGRSDLLAPVGVYPGVERILFGERSPLRDCSSIARRGLTPHHLQEPITLAFHLRRATAPPAGSRSTTTSTPSEAYRAGGLPNGTECSDLTRSSCSGWMRESTGRRAQVLGQSQPRERGNYSRDLVEALASRVQAESCIPSHAMHLGSVPSSPSEEIKRTSADAAPLQAIRRSATQAFDFHRATPDRFAPFPRRAWRQVYLQASRWMYST